MLSLALRTFRASHRQQILAPRPLQETPYVVGQVNQVSDLSVDQCSPDQRLRQLVTLSDFRGSKLESEFRAGGR